MNKPTSVSFADVDFKEYYENIQTSRIVRTAGDPNAYVSVMSYLENPVPGTPCELFSKDRLNFLPGDVTIWAGINGHGKSLLTGQVISQLMMRKERCFLMSLEMLPRYTFLRMMRQAFGRKVTKNDGDLVKRWFEFASTRLVYLDQVGAVSPLECLGVISYVADVYRCKHIFVDNLLRVVPGETDYDKQKDFMQALCERALEGGTHIHVVHHCRKSKDETDRIGKFSLRGSAAVADQAANIITIQRNLEKERKRQEGRLSPEEDAAEFDVQMSLEKNRNGDWQGAQPLWFDPRSTAYSVSSDRFIPRLWTGETETLEEVAY